MAFILPELPYGRTALEPHMSGETLDYHHGKHHKAYVDKLNEFTEKGDAPRGSLLDVVRSGKKGPVFNNAAQIWNHSFFWLCLTPKHQAVPTALQEKLDATFGSVDEFITRFAAQAAGHFGSGWAWLVDRGGTLEITAYHDADTPVAHPGVAPLFTLDVWEHAYYIDHRNARPKFIETVLRNLVNWEFIATNLDGKGAERADQPG